MNYLKVIFYPVLFASIVMAVLVIAISLATKNKKDDYAYNKAAFHSSLEND
jgi:hypothetical protein